MCTVPAYASQAVETPSILLSLKHPDPNDSTWIDINLENKRERFFTEFIFSNRGSVKVLSHFLPKIKFAEMLIPAL